MEADSGFTPPREESREIFGVRLTQARDSAALSRDLLTVDTGVPLPAAIAEPGGSVHSDEVADACREPGLPDRPGGPASTRPGLGYRGWSGMTTRLT